MSDDGNEKKSFLEGFFSRWSELSGKRKRFIVLLLLFILVAFGFAYANKGKKKDRTPTVADVEAQFNLGGDDMVQEKFHGVFESQLQSMERALSDERKKREQLEKQINEIAANGVTRGKGGQAAPKGPYTEERFMQDINKVLSEDAALQGVDIAELAPPPPPALKKDAAKGKGGKGREERSQSVAPATVARTTAASAPKGPSRGVNGTASDKERGFVVHDFTKDEEDGEMDAKGGSDAKAKEREQAIYIPSTTFVEGFLLVGADAPTHGKAQSQPHPLMIRLQDLSFLPNGVRQDLEGCHIYAECYGDLSSERAYARLQQISCVNRDNLTVIDQPIKGYLADNDSKVGLRGQVVSKRGAMLARTLWAAFIEGVAQGFQQSSTTVVTTAEGTVQQPDTVDNFSNGFTTGFSSGASEAAQKLSEWYLKQADQLWPVVSIAGQRHVTVIFSEGTELKFKDKKLLSGERGLADAHL